MQEIDQPGRFYLGRDYDLAARQVLPTPVLYDSEDLTTHAVCVGMTGSGKTGLCLSLLEEAALDGIPAIAIDPKGDLGNLLLAFPELRPSDFRPWIDESAAGRKGVTPDQLAEQTAAQWRDGLAAWGEDGERIRRYTQAVDRAIYTPGSSAGLPLTVLKSLGAPPPAVRDDDEALRDRIQGTVSGLLGLMGVDADPVNSRAHILISRVLEGAWRAGRDLDLPALIGEIGQPPFKRVGVIELESFFPAKDRHALGMQLNNLLASPSFAGWLEGEPLDVERLLHTRDGKPRLSVVSIAHLNESERMFFVTILLNDVIAWMRTQPGTGSLRAILYMDEVFGFFPPSANPPAKRPMLTLLKQARAYGLGCVLATQNPVDLDYKGLSNAGTWFLGRLQTERDKLRVIEGLEGASTEAGSQFNRQQMEATLAALDKRVFVMNNVHDAGPKVFHTRWAMSYLRGPMTGRQISTLMAERKKSAAEQSIPQPRASATGPVSRDAPAERVATAAPLDAALRPVLAADIPQRFYPLDPHAAALAGEQLAYRPALLGSGRLHYSKSNLGLDAWRDFAALQPVHGALPTPPWESAMIFDREPTLEAEPQSGAAFGDLPGELTIARNYRRWDDDLKSHVYQHQRLVLWQCQEFDKRSLPDESEAEFRARLTPEIIKKLEAELEASQQEAEKYRWWWLAFIGKAAARSVEILLTGMLGRRSRKQVVTSTVWGEAMRDRRRYADAKAAFKKRQAELKKLTGPNSAVHAPSAEAVAAVALERLEIPPLKGDIAVDEVLLAWLPWWVSENGDNRPAY